MKRTATIFTRYATVAKLGAIALSVIMLSVGPPSYAQTLPSFDGQHLAHWDQQQYDQPSARVEGASHRALTSTLTAYDLYELDAEAIDRFVKSSPASATFQLTLGDKYRWEITLEENNLLSPDYQSFALTPNGKIAMAPAPTVTFRGKLNSEDGGEVRLLLDGNQLKGFVTVDDKKIYLENLSGLAPSAEASQFVLYSEDAVQEEGSLLCLAKEEQAYDKQVEDRINQRAANGCEDQAQLEIATLALYDRLNSAGGENAVNNEILGILNNVQANYTRFSIKFKVIEQVASTCSNCDPWTTTDPSNILRQFTNWASSGFNQGHDAGICFFDGNGSGTVGVAWVGAICTSSRYSVCDKLRTSESNRVLVAHEMGHNFGARHDNSGAPFIMAPSVNSSTSWSNNSVSSIENHISSRGCLSCVGGGGTPPPPTCSVPSNLKVSSVSTTTVSLDWGNASGANSYRVQYRRQGTSSWSSGTVEQSSASISNLSANTTYQWRVRTSCSDGNSEYISGPNFTTQPEDTDGCAAPTELTVDNIGSSTASFDWRGVNGAQNYTYRIRRKGSSRWYSFNVGRSNISIRGMRGGTTYQWRVRTNCSDGSSNYVTGPEFTTTANQMASATSDVVWSESFSAAENSTSGSAWSSETTHSEGGSAKVIDGRFTINNATAAWQSEKIDISTLPGFELTYDIESNVTASGSEIIFYYRVDGNNWEEVDRQTEAVERKSVTISGMATGDWLELRFVANTTSNEQAYRLDNIKVLCPSCVTEESSLVSVLTTDDELVDVTAYPNPYLESFKVELPEEMERVEAKIFDIQGKVVQQVQYTSPQRSLELGKGLDPGLYIMQLSGPDFLREIKVTKQE